MVLLLRKETLSCVEFKIARLDRDFDLLDDVAAEADSLLAADTQAVSAMIRRWIGENKKDYGGV